MKRLYYLSLLAFLGFASKAAGQSMNLYEMDTIQTIELTFTQPNWDYQMDTAKSGSQGYLLAAECKINGVLYDSVGVKYKGNSSYSAARVKNPLHIKLDHVHSGADYQGYNDLKLNNGFKDPSFLREVMAYSILRQYMFAPQANYARLYINGTFWGLYTNVEDVNNDFSERAFLSSGNAYFKCNPNYGSGGASDLRYLGADSSLYFNSYELQSDAGWNELVDLCDTLNNLPSQINAIFDVDRALWMHAFNDVLVNLDSYSGAIKQNYYLYRGENKSFNPVIWDLNESFGAFNNSGSGGPLSVSSMQTLTPLLHASESNWPLIYRLLADPMYKRMYLAHMRTIVDENFAADQYLTTAYALQALVDSTVNADPNKLFTYSNFVDGLTVNVMSMGTIPGISVLMDSRTPYLQGTTELSATPPTISAITVSDPTPTVGDSVWVTASVTSPTFVALGSRLASWQRFVRTQMFDDGAHGDGAAGDGVYGARLVCGSGSVEYYLYAENANAGIFSPERAEFEFHTLSPTAVEISAGSLVINEFMASNSSAVTDPAGGYSDWIELYNNTGSDLNLTSLYLTDDYAVPTKWEFPSETTIAAFSYLIVWCDQDMFEPGIHANFKLSGSGEQILMSYASGNVIDSVTFGAQTANVSMERCPNGTGPFMVATPHTHNAPNCSLGQTPAIEAGDWLLYPNPASEAVWVSGDELISRAELLSVTGQVVQVLEMAPAQQAQLDLGGLPNGMYLLRLNGGDAFLKLVVSR
jgi:spore coat protein CotH